MADADDRPGPERLDEAALVDLVARHQHCVLSTIRADGRPHLSNMVYAWSPEERLLRFTTTEDRIKVRHLRADPRGAALVSTEDHWAYAVVDGTAELSPVTTEPGDATGLELLALHGDDSEDREALLAELVGQHRLVIRLHADHLYGARLPMPG